MNDKYGELTDVLADFTLLIRDLRIDIEKLKKHVGELIIEGSGLKIRLDNIDRNQPIVDAQFNWLRLWVIALEKRPH